MPVIRTEAVEIRSASDVVAVRQAVRSWAIEAGFTLVDQTKIVTAASELARNTVDYGGGGVARLEMLTEGPRRGLRVAFEDQGPGIADISKALTDHYTTGGGLGLGLGGAKRLVNEFDISSRVGEGTRVVITRWEIIASIRYDHGSGFAVAIDDSSQIGEARRSAATLAASVGLDHTEAGRIAIIATEAATNIAKHAGRGEIILRSVDSPTVKGVELIAIDRGPGIVDVDRALRDGFSTAGSSGTGLGALARLASHFDIFSSPGAGTVLSARVVTERPGVQPVRTLEIGVVRVAKRGESDCGDDWVMVLGENGKAMLAMADGLGHGTAAADALRRAVEIAAEHPSDAAGMIVGHIHAGLRATRGAAVAVAELTSTGALAYSGLGNISATVITGGASKSLVSHNGIAGHEMRKIQEFSYQWPPGALLVMHSDGISARWDLSRYPGLAMRDPSVVAGVIYRDFSRGRDDSLVVVVRNAD